MRKWRQALNPVYFLLVIVPADCQDWLEHDIAGTMHRAAAFWRRIRADEIGTSLGVSKTQRLTLATFDEWRNDLLMAYTPGGAP